MPAQFSRTLGDNELSYFLPSPADGVNDMYMHLGFRAPPALLSPSRMCIAWAILRGRHPLLAAHVHMKPEECTAARFVYTAPASPAAALAEARASFDTRTSTRDALIDAYLNGPRTLSPTRLSYLILASPPARTPSTSSAPPDRQEFDLLLCAPHFLGDSMALRTCTNDLLLLLTTHDDAALTALLTDQWAARWAPPHTETDALPASLEARFPPTLHASQRAAHVREFQDAVARVLGMHAFTPASRAAPRRTVVHTMSFDPVATRAALATCKARGVSLANAIFALCNVARARAGGATALPKLPTLMYSALNLRSYLTPAPTAHPSYWFLSIGCFNIVLPPFLSEDVHAAFWADAHTAQAQSVLAAKVARARCTAQEYGARARAPTAPDDRVASAPVLSSTPGSTLAPTPATAPKTPSTALTGLSLLGNLDPMYAHAAYASAGVVLHTLTTGTRQRAGGMLLLAYTFTGRLWLSLGHDSAAYKEGEVERWWEGIQAGVGEFLVQGESEGGLLSESLGYSARL